MTKTKSLVNGIGNISETKKYYDDWSKEYEANLHDWNYLVPKTSIKLLQAKLTKKPKYILDLACGTGLFGCELKRVFNNSQIYGSDISKKSLTIAKKKYVYKNLTQINFEKKKVYKIKFELVSMIGAMTYCKKFDNLFFNIRYYLQKNGYFIFSHRTDLWQEQKFINILKNHKDDFIIKYISRPINYLPLNKDYSDKIKIRLVLLQKKTIK